MKAVRMTVMAAAILVAGSIMAAAASQQSFDAMKQLNGNWEGKIDGKPLLVSFKVTAGGSALMSEIHGMGEDMVSMFHPDGERLLMTHYCAAGNQPRMQGTASPDGKTITFNFIDGTNITPSSRDTWKSWLLPCLIPAVTWKLGLSRARMAKK